MEASGLTNGAVFLTRDQAPNFRPSRSGGRFWRPKPGAAEACLLRFASIAYAAAEGDDRDRGQSEAR